MTEHIDQTTADEAVEKLRKLLDDGEITTFTQEESAALKEVAEAWRSAKGFVTIMQYTGGTLRWCVLFAATYAAIKAGFLDFLWSGSSK